jgi:hypothetical protein
VDYADNTDTIAELARAEIDSDSYFSISQSAMDNRAEIEARLARNIRDRKHNYWLDQFKSEWYKELYYSKDSQVRKEFKALIKKVVKEYWREIGYDPRNDRPWQN